MNNNLITVEREKTADALTMNTKCTCEFKLVYLRRSLIKSKKRFDLAKKKQQRMQQFCIVTLSKKKRKNRPRGAEEKREREWGKWKRCSHKGKLLENYFSCPSRVQSCGSEREATKYNKKKEKQKNQAAGIKKALNTLSIIIPHSRAYSWLFNNFGVSVLFATLRPTIQ